MKSILKSFKKSIKEKASQIRAMKRLFREYQRIGDEKSYILQSELLRLRDEFRHEHIAYCILRGRTILEIENSPSRETNKSKIKNILLRIFSEIEASRILEAAYLR